MNVIILDVRPCLAVVDFLDTPWQDNRHRRHLECPADTPTKKNEAQMKVAVLEPIDIRSVHPSACTHARTHKQAHTHARTHPRTHTCAYTRMNALAVCMGPDGSLTLKLWPLTTAELWPI